MTAPIPMFPLGTVLLPHNPLPLHVFEPRYRQLVVTVMADDRRFGVVLIQRGSEVGGGEVRTDMGCLAEIRDARQLDDGQWALMAVGVERIRIVEWLPDDPHPWAVVEAWPDDDEGQVDIEPVLQRLRRSLALSAELGETAVPATLDLGDDPVLAVDLAAGAAPLGPLDRQALLGCAGPASRARRLVAELDATIELLEARITMR